MFRFKRVIEAHVKCGCKDEGYYKIVENPDNLYCYQKMKCNKCGHEIFIELGESSNKTFITLPRIDPDI
jgi:hypothetical protein